ncbi:MAG: alpha/beta hydrolase family protein [Polaribacter sp.]
MIRVITYLVVYIFGVTVAIAQIKTEEITINNQAIQLPGTLTYSAEKQPLIIWVHGSGSVDRNGNTPQYIKQFRDLVNKENIAFFSYDKRIANRKNASFLKDGVFINDFIFDIREVVHHFKKDKRFTKIILAGHSQGSLIAMMALKNLDKYISIAGAGETIDKTLVRQITAQSPIFGALTVQYFKELKETGEIKEVDPNLMSLFAKPNQPFLSSWIELNPLEEIKKVTIPTLIINGDKDFQVLISDAENLKKAKPDAEYVVIKNMNHVLKNIENEEDNLKSYNNPDFPVSKQLIQTIVSFVKK